MVTALAKDDRYRAKAKQASVQPARMLRPKASLAAHKVARSPKAAASAQVEAAGEAGVAIAVVVALRCQTTLT